MIQQLRTIYYSRLSSVDWPANRRVRHVTRDAAAVTTDSCCSTYCRVSWLYCCCDFEQLTSRSRVCVIGQLVYLLWTC